MRKSKLKVRNIFLLALRSVEFMRVNLRLVLNLNIDLM